MSYLIQNDITKTAISLLLKEPFYGHFFAGLLREISEQTQSLSISLVEGKPALIVHPDFWAALSTDTDLKYGYVKHQLLHLSLKHPFVRDDFYHKNIFDIAADLVVNQYIAAQFLANDAVTLERYPKFRHFEKNKSVSYYYQKILEIQEQNKEPDAGLPNSDNSQLQQHRHWNAFNESPKMEQRILKDNLDETILQAAERTDEKLIAALPSHLLRLIQKQKAARKVVLDWKRLLKIFLGTGRKTYLKNTIRRPSKRYGTTPGIQVKSKQKILVALDTSGSISPEELAVFYQEMKQIQNLGAIIRVVECDAEIQSVYAFDINKKTAVKGGGGTNFDPVIRYANEHEKPDAIIYFTDGYAPALTIMPKSPILWLISREGIQKGQQQWNELKGRKVSMS